ncbi:MAG TPA: hypothetical protein VFV51_15165 [Vicinamibacterales bacterium]|nr:hypothetical protein [Vicinamibacterales bacterium]
MTVTDWPAMVTVAVRVSPVFAAMVRPTVPVPFPDAPEFTTTNDAFDVAVHVHPLFAVTPTVAVAPVATTLNVVVDNVKVHDGDGWVGDRESELEHDDASTASRAIHQKEHSARMDRA